MTRKMISVPTAKPSIEYIKIVAEDGSLVSERLKYICSTLSSIKSWYSLLLANGWGVEATVACGV